MTCFADTFTRVIQNNDYASRSPKSIDHTMETFPNKRNHAVHSQAFHWSGHWPSYWICRSMKRNRSIQKVWLWELVTEQATSYRKKRPTNERPSQWTNSPEEKRYCLLWTSELKWRIWSCYKGRSLTISTNVWLQMCNVSLQRATCA